MAQIKEASYASDPLWNENEPKWASWLQQYAKRLLLENVSQEERQKNMLSVNPKYVLRNYMAQLAIEDAEKGKYDLLHEMHKLLKKPYAEQAEMEKWFALRPDWALNKVGCSQLSCSS